MPATETDTTLGPPPPPGGRTAVAAPEPPRPDGRQLTAYDLGSIRVVVDIHLHDRERLIESMVQSVTWIVERHVDQVLGRISEDGRDH